MRSNCYSTRTDARSCTRFAGVAPKSAVPNLVDLFSAGETELALRFGKHQVRIRSEAAGLVCGRMIHSTVQEVFFGIHFRACWGTEPYVALHFVYGAGSCQGGPCGSTLRITTLLHSEKEDRLFQRYHPEGPHPGTHSSEA